jgi:hypothetical protein
VNDSSIVHVLHRVNGLVEDPRDVFFIAFESGHELSSLDVFHEQEDMVFVAEVAVKFDDVGVVHNVEDLQFQQKLGLHFVLPNRGLEHFFQRENCSCHSVSADIDLSKFAGAYAVSYFEITQS